MRLGICSCVCVPAVLAQLRGGLSTDIQRPVERPSPLPSFQPPPSPALELELPPVPSPPPEAAPRPGTMVRLVARQFRVVGSTVFSDAQLDEITRPYTDRTITFEDLEALRHALSVLYVEHGYVNSGAVIPDQEIVDGVITIQIVEGRLVETQVEGTRWFRASYIRNRIMRHAGPPLDINQLQLALQLLQQNPEIRQINAELSPGLALGEAVLKVKVHEEVPYALGLEFDNYQPPGIGSEQGIIQLWNRNVTGNGDTLFFAFNVTDGLEEYTVDYTVPVTAYDTTVDAQYQRTNSVILQAPFNTLNIEGNTDQASVLLRQPLYRTATQQLTASLGGEYEHSETFLLGEPFSFSPGAKNGRSTVAALRIYQEWIDRSPVQVIAALSRFSIGVDALGATINHGSEPDGRFFAWLGQVQWARRLPLWDIEALALVAAQLTPDRLLALEQFAVGGRYTVRGYPENQLARDNAAVGSLELRVPVWRNSAREPVVQLASFGDVGGGWAAKGPTPDPKYLASVGLGLRWTPFWNTHFEIYWGIPLKNVPESGNDLQDHGISLQLRTEWNLPERFADIIQPWRY